MQNRLIFKPEIKNLVIQYPIFSEQGYEEYKRKHFLALQKFKSSRKTKAVHHLIETNNFIHSMFAGDGINKITAVTFQDNKLLMINLNADKFADFVIGDGASKTIFELNKIYDNIEKEKTIVSQYQMLNIEKLINNFKQKEQYFLSIFDYMKSIDGIYYGYLTYLIRRILLNNPTQKKKLLELSVELFQSILIKLYLKSTKTHPDSNIKQFLYLIALYFVFNYYLGLKSNEIILRVKKIFGEADAEFLQRIKHTKIEKLEDIVYLLNETEVLKIQTSFFRTLMYSFFEETGYELIEFSLQSALAFFCSINHQNILFNSITPNEKITFRIEELILNEKRNIIIVPQKSRIIYFDQG